MNTINLKSLSIINFRYILSLICITIAVSGVFINTIQVLGFNVSEFFLIFAYFLNRKKLNGLIKTNKKYLNNLLILISFIAIWVIFSINTASIYDSQKDILREARSFSWIIIAFYLCRLHQNISNEYLPRIIIHSSFLFPIFQIFRIILGNNLASVFFLETKVYIPMLLLTTSFLALLSYKRKWLALFLLLLWTPGSIISLFRICILVVLTLYFSWIYFFLSELFKSSRIKKIISFSIISVVAIIAFNNLDGFDNTLTNFAALIAENFPRAFNQIIYKTFYLQEKSGDFLRIEMFKRAISLPNILPSTLGANLFIDNVSQKSITSEFNVLDSGFFYIANRFGIFWIPSIIFFINKIIKGWKLNLIAITGIVIFIETFLFTGQDIYLSYCAASLGIFLCFMTFNRKINKEDSFKQKIYRNN